MRCNIEQDRQYTYNVTLVVFVQPLLHWKINKNYILWVCVCGCSNPASVHASYCHLWPTGSGRIFTHFLINVMIFKQKLLNMKCGFWFSLQFLSEIFLIPREFMKISKKYVGLYVKHPLFLSDFNELNFLDRFSKNSKISGFMIICPVGSELFHVDRHQEANSCFL